MRVMNPFTGNRLQESSVLHFGLGDATEAELTIKWPSGFETVYQVGAEELNRYNHIAEPATGTMVLPVAQPFQATSKLNEETILEIPVSNIGLNPITITDIELGREYFSVIESPTTIQSQITDTIRVRMLTTNLDQLGDRTDTLKVNSTAINSPVELLISTSARSSDAPFSDAPSGNKPFLEFNGFSGSGSADFNNDLTNDFLLFLSGRTDRVFLSESDDSHFLDEDNALAASSSFNTSAAFADFDRDGYVDVLMGVQADENRLYKNLGDGNFSEVTVPVFQQIIANPSKVSFYDLDGNANPEIIITNSTGGANEIWFYNAGAETYEPRLAETDQFTDGERPANSHAIGDLDNDGLADIILATSEGVTFYKQMRDQDGVQIWFEETTVEGLSNREITASGVQIADFNNDERPDVLVTTSQDGEQNILLTNNGGLAFTPLAPHVFENLSQIPSDVAIMDHNQDGFFDIFFPDAIFENNSVLLESVAGRDFLVINSGSLSETENKVTVSALPFDYNSDGGYDLFVTHVLSTNQLFLGDPPSRNWLKIYPWSLQSNGERNLVPGTVVKVTTEVGGRSRTATHVIGGLTGKNQILGPALVGLDQAESASVEVIYTNGETVQVEATEVNREISVERLLVSNDEGVDNLLPSRFELHQNYPNPFNPTTTIQFDLPLAADVDLRVFDLLGREVAVLAQGRMPAGSHTQQWDAKSLASGLYLAVLRAGSQSKVMKMLLLK